MNEVTHIAWQRDQGQLRLSFLRMEQQSADEVAFVPVAAVPLSDAQLQHVATQLAGLVHFQPPDEGACYLLDIAEPPPLVAPAPPVVPHSAAIAESTYRRKEAPRDDHRLLQPGPKPQSNKRRNRHNRRGGANPRRR